MKRPKLIPQFRDIPSPRQPMPELSLEERKLNFREVDLGYTEEMALKEAARCLSCRKCIGCGLCLAECDQQAIVYDQSPEVLTIEADGLIYAGDGMAYNPTEDWLGYARFANVVTSYELERLLSPSGPFGGYVLKLSDGELPKSICFIQCVGSRRMGAEFCSTECCRTTLLQVKRLRQMIPDVTISVFHKGLRPCGKDGEVLLRQVEQSDWVELIEDEVKEISETEDGEIAVRFGEKDSVKKFDLVVLAVGIRPSQDIKRISLLRNKTNGFGFFDCSLNDLLTGSSSVAVASRLCGLIETEYALLLARLIRNSDGSYEKDSERKPLSGNSILLFGCEYGFKARGGEDLDGILKRLQKEDENVLLGGVYKYLCHREGRMELAKKAKAASRIVIIGCYSKSQEATFADILNTSQESVTIVSSEHANSFTLKSLDSTPGLSQRKTSRGNSRDVVIVGGGISGLAAASVLVDHNIRLHIVEKEPQVGGALGKLATMGEVQSTAFEAFLDKIRKATNVKFYTDARIKGYERINDNHKLQIEFGGGSVEIDSGILLIATGPIPYKPQKYGYGSNPNVMTQDEFYQLFSSRNLKAERIAVVQCVGARDEHPYCSRYCCPQALKNAIRFKTEFANSKVVVLHRGLRLFGFDESLYGEAIERGIEFIQSDSGVAITGDRPLKLDLKHGKGLKAITIDADIAVLSVGHCQTATYSTLRDIFGLDLDQFGFVRTGFGSIDDHKTSLDGVYVCGFARQPMAAQHAFIDGLAAGFGILRVIGEVSK